jgi:hypothetical protein
MHCFVLRPDFCTLFVYDAGYFSFKLTTVISYIKTGGSNLFVFHADY